MVVEIGDDGVVRFECVTAPTITTIGAVVSGVASNLTLNAPTGKSVVLSVGGTTQFSVSAGSAAARSGVAATVSGVVSAAAGSLGVGSVSGGMVAGTLAATTLSLGTLRSVTLGAATLTVASLAAGTLTHTSGSLFADLVSVSGLATIRGGVAGSLNTLASLVAHIQSGAGAGSLSSARVYYTGSNPSASMSGTLYYYSVQGATLANNDRVLNGTVLKVFTQPADRTAAGTFTAAASQSAVVVVTETPAQGLYSAAGLELGRPSAVKTGVLWLTDDGVAYNRNARPSGTTLASWDVLTAPSTTIRDQIAGYATARLANGVNGDALLASIRSGGGSSDGAQLSAARTVGSLWVNVVAGANMYSYSAAVSAWTV